MLPRGIRNNNPGNIRKSREKWQGLAAKQLDKDFFQFVTAPWGIRALLKVLTTYQAKHGLKTVRDIIGRWAPPHENDTGAYARAVAKALKVKLDDEINLSDRAVLRLLAEAIIMHENGMQPFTPAVLDKAFELAGL